MSEDKEKEEHVHDFGAWIPAPVKYRPVEERALNKPVVVKARFCKTCGFMEQGYE